MRLELGVVVATPGAIEVLAPGEALALLRRHQSGDWGRVDAHDRRENELSVKRGFRVLSSYVAASGAKVWVITEADRSSTCILLPEEY
ncbi:MAG: hypothetical protein M3R38_05485 [Actinomycetota bacterium]|nr:hypothetical protein [Actinomycetota bacterium]